MKKLTDEQIMLAAQLMVETANFVGQMADQHFALIEQLSAAKLFAPDAASKISHDAEQMQAYARQLSSLSAHARKMFGGSTV